MEVAIDIAIDSSPSAYLVSYRFLWLEQLYHIINISTFFFLNILPIPKGTREGKSASICIEGLITAFHQRTFFYGHQIGASFGLSGKHL